MTSCFVTQSTITKYRLILFYHFSREKNKRNYIKVSLYKVIQLPSQRKDI